MRRRLAVIPFALFVLLAALVAHGTFHAADQHAVGHWMPWLQGKSHPLVTISTLFVPETRWTLGGTLVALWTYPASVLPSALVVGLVAWRLRDPRPAILWVAANAVELVGKGIVERPALYAHGRHVTGFDHSLPSGHTMRSLVVAWALAALWRRGRLAYAWALTVPFALVVLGDHVPTDVVAGLLVFVALALAV
ncbi:MAG TPA: phosphatase PAP2 family protein [Gaiellaceae bacterium]|nr:phosphatase PAP2 family protein [Gaiellaceae bacterium]